MITNKRNRKSKSNGKTKTKKRIMKGGSFKVNSGNTSGHKGKTKPGLWTRLTTPNPKKIGTVGSALGSKKNSKNREKLKKTLRQKSGLTNNPNENLTGTLKRVRTTSSSNKTKPIIAMTRAAQNFYNLMMGTKKQLVTTTAPAPSNPHYYEASSSPSPYYSLGASDNTNYDNVLPDVVTVKQSYDYRKVNPNI